MVFRSFWRRDPHMTVWLRSRVVGLLVATVFANGCGDTQGVPPEGIPASGGSSAEQATRGSGGVGGTVVVAPLDSGPIAADQICPSLARAACEGAHRCCSTFAGTDAAITDCLAAQTTQCQTQLLPLVSDTRSGYDPQAAAAAVSTYRTALATCDLSFVEYASARDGLLRMFAGTVAAGGACPPADLNDGAAIVSCLAPAICHVAGVGGARLTGICEPVSASTRPCLLDTECDPHLSLRCDFNSPVSGNVSSSGEEGLGLHGHCVARLADGTACARATECTSLVCENKRCAPRTSDRVYCLAH